VILGRIKYHTYSAKLERGSERRKSEHLRVRTSKRKLERSERRKSLRRKHDRKSLRRKSNKFSNLTLPNNQT
jgi:hypothetical protein